MARWKEAYVISKSAAAINASAFEDFGNDSASIKLKDRHGSANSLLITSLAAEDFTVMLDNQTVQGILFTRGSFRIAPEEGIYFSHVRLTNVSATNSSADEVKIRIARADYIGA